MIDVAYAMFLQARSAVTSARYPSRLAYRIDVTGLDGSVPADDHYRAACDPGTGDVRVFPISDEQLAAPPPVPRGINFKFTIALCVGGCAGVVIPIGRPEKSSDLFGVPLLDPTYMFGLRYRSSSQTGDAAAAESALPVIAVVSSGAPEYRVTLIDAADIDGTATYHLRLVPLRRPRENRLRELWIGTRDALPRKAIVSGNFRDRPLIDVPWTIDFTVIDGAPYLVRETADAKLYLDHRRVVRDAAIAFDDVREPNTFFDRPLVTPEETRTAPILVEPEGKQRRRVVRRASSVSSKPSQSSRRITSCRRNRPCRRRKPRRTLSSARAYRRSAFRW